MSVEKDKASGKTSEPTSEPKQLSKKELKEVMAVEYNLLSSRLQSANLGVSRELNLAITNLEQSYLWFANAVDKYEAK